MSGRIQRLAELLKTASPKRQLALAGILLIAIIAIPLTVLTSQQQQNLKQNAATSCDSTNVYTEQCSTTSTTQYQQCQQTSTGYSWASYDCAQQHPGTICQTAGTKVAPNGKTVPNISCVYTCATADSVSKGYQCISGTSCGSATPISTLNCAPGSVCCQPSTPASDCTAAQAQAGTQQCSSNNAAVQTCQSSPINGTTVYRWTNTSTCSNGCTASNGKAQCVASGTVHYSCNSTTKVCSQDTSGPYTDFTSCNANCNPVSNQKYSCSTSATGAKSCVANGAGNFTDLGSCQANCGGTTTGAPSAPTNPLANPRCGTGTTAAVSFIDFTWTPVAGATSYKITYTDWTGAQHPYDSTVIPNQFSIGTNQVKFTSPLKVGNGGASTECSNPAGTGYQCGFTQCKPVTWQVWAVNSKGTSAPATGLPASLTSMACPVGASCPTSGGPTCNPTATPNSVAVKGKSSVDAKCSADVTSWTWSEKCLLGNGTGVPTNTTTGKFDWVAPDKATTCTETVKGCNAAGQCDTKSVPITVKSSTLSCTVSADPNSVTPKAKSTLTAKCDTAVTNYFWSSDCGTPGSATTTTATNPWTAPDTVPASGKCTVKLTGCTDSSKTTCAPETTTDISVATGTLLALDLGLDGIGTTGDQVNANPIANSDSQYRSNPNPQHTTRTVKVAITDTSGKAIETDDGEVKYVPDTGRFTGSVKLSDGFTTGTYNLSIKSPAYKPLVASGKSITSKATTDPVKGNLIAGDINNDDKIDISDFNILFSCSLFSTDTGACSSNGNYPTYSDLTDNGGKPDHDDYNLLLREWSVTNGN